MTNRKTLYVTGAIAAVALVGGAALMGSEVLGVFAEDPWDFPGDPLEVRHPGGMNDGEPFEVERMRDVRGIVRAYGVPHYVEVVPHPETDDWDFGGTIEVRRNQRLETTLEQIEASAPFPLAWDAIDGVVRIYRGEVPEGERCLPSVPVTVQGTMTAWEAIKATLKQMNNAYWPLGERPLKQSEGVRVGISGVGLLALSDGRGWRNEGVGLLPPDRFGRDPIELDLEDVPAREALARIQAASGYAFDMSYGYFSDQRDGLTVFLNWGDTRDEEQAKKDAHRATLEEAVLWSTARREVRKGEYGVDWEWDAEELEQLIGPPLADRKPYG
ncbi:MAG: hypothetical protein R6W89_11010, partial [Candidatus Hydrogenedentota bacterium]